MLQWSKLNEWKKTGGKHNNQHFLDYKIKIAFQEENNYVSALTFFFISVPNSFYLEQFLNMKLLDRIQNRCRRRVGTLKNNLYDYFIYNLIQIWHKIYRTLN